MNHIKSYKLFESKFDIKSTVQDICTDLKDEGFEFDIFAFDQGFYLIIKKKDQKFAYFDIKETIDKLLSYLSDNYLLKSQHARIKQGGYSVIEDDDLRKLIKNGDKSFFEMTFVIIKKPRP